MKARLASVAVGLMLVSMLVGCVDEVDGEEDNTFNIGERESWESMDGPPGRINDVLGMVDGRLYADVSAHWRGLSSHSNTVVGVYDTGGGWESDEELTDIFDQDRVESLSHARPKIVALNGDHYVHNGAGELYRTTDGGDSWESWMSPPVGDEERIEDIEAGETSLFVATGDQTSASLWRAEPGDEVFEEVRSREAADPSSRPTVRGESGVLFYDDGETLFSMDSGESWEAVDGSCEDVFPTSGVTLMRPAGSPFEYQGELYFGDGPELLRFDDGECQRFEPGPLNAGDGDEDTSTPSADESSAYRVVDGTLFGFSDQGFGRVDSDLSGWADVREVPDRISRVSSGFSPGIIFEAGAGTIGIAHRLGVWTTDDEGETWESAPHDWSSPSWAVEHRGEVFVPELVAVYRSDVDRGEWSAVDDGHDGEQGNRPGEWIERDGSVFAVSWADPKIFSRNDDGTFERIWPEEIGENSVMGGIRAAADLRFGDDGVFAGLAGDQVLASAPDESPEVGDETSDVKSAAAEEGGLFAASSVEAADFERFGQNHPTDDEGRPVDVTSMALQGGSVWVLTGTRGVWRVDIADEEWHPAHEGLPIGSSSEGLGAEPETWPVFDVEAFGDEVYAWSPDVIYRWDGSCWSEFSAEPFSMESDGSGVFPYPGLRDLVEYEGRLTVVHHRGVYELDRDTGERRLAWEHPEGRELVFGSVTESGLYVGVQNDGVWRHR